MNKKMGLAIILVSMLLTALGSAVHMVKAESNNPIGFSGGITVYSPVDTTYDSNFLTLNLTCTCGAGLHFSLNYTIDGKYETPINLVYNGTPGFPLMAPENGLAQLPKLSEGSHRLTIYEEATLNDFHGANPPGAPFKETAPGSANWVASWVDTADFTIASSAATPDLTPPNVTNLSMENQTYNTTAEIPINFTVDKSISQAAYSLDGQANVTIAGNSTLTGLSIGAHNVTVYAWDEAGNVGASQTVNFAVANITSTAVQPSEPFPIALIIAAFVGSTIAVALTVLFFFKKSKK